MDNKYDAVEESTGSDIRSLDKQPGYIRNPPVRKIVEQQIAEYKKQIEVRENLLAKLDANKGVEEVLDILRKVGI